MKKSFQPFFIFALFLVFYGCQPDIPRKDRVAAMIGDLEAPFLVTAFTPENLVQKSGIRDGALPMTYETFMGFIFLEEATGIDNHEQVQIVATNSNGLIPNVYGFVPLKDANKFEQIVKKELGATIQEKDGVKFFRKDKDSYVVAWKNDIAVTTNVPINLENIFSKSANDSKKAAVKLVNLINNVDQTKLNTDYRQFLDKEGDIIAYLHGESAYDVLSAYKLIPTKNKKEAKYLLQGTKAELSVKFENGLVKFDSDYTLSDSLVSKLNFIGKKGISQEMLQYSMSENPEFAMAFNMPAKGVLDFLRKNDDMGDFEDFEEDLREFGLKPEDIENIFTGEALVMSGFSLESFSPNNHYQKPVGIVLNLNDEGKLMPFLDSLDTDPEQDFIQAPDGMILLVKDGKLFVTDYLAWAHLVNNSKTVTITDTEKILTSNAFGLLANTEHTNWNDFDLDGTAQVLTNSFASSWGFANPNLAKLQINFKNADQNALRTLVESFINLFEGQTERDNQDLKDLLDEEVIESAMGEVEEALEDLDEELSDIFK